MYIRQGVCGVVGAMMALRYPAFVCDVGGVGDMMWYIYIYICLGTCGGVGAMMLFIYPICVAAVGCAMMLFIYYMLVVLLLVI